ncbi:MAG: tRNA lysidine(34) synthetase TilS [Acidobacteria bacterium]|nr:tRNA lysidine(34) synthetase TilS [Acidobacteriota bacterium]
MLLADQVREYVRRQGLLHPGDRVGVAVSGGADSVALLRLLLELRGELGVVLSVLHFHHGIRDAEADADQRFVAELAAAHGLELHVEAGDAPAHAAAEGLSLEAAARELRYTWFHDLLGRVLKRIATAHTLDDQAETVLMRTLRGAGTRGVAGIYPEVGGRTRPRVRRRRTPQAGEVARSHASIIRPLLRTRRRELLDYLRSLGQEWREDLSNRDQRYLRNRIRRQLVPMLERDFNPRVAEALANQAEVARAEEEFWQQQVSQLLPGVLASPASEGAAVLLSDALLAHPLALRRRLLRAASEAAGVCLEFDEVEAVLRLAAARAGTTCSLPRGWRARRGLRELRIEKQAGAGRAATDYEYRLPVPGEVRVAEIGSVIRASVVPPAGSLGRYNALLPDAPLPATELVVRNWRAGDRFQPAHTRSPKKVKTLLQDRRVALAERRLWPVVLSGGTIIWMRGFTAPARASQAQVRIEEVETFDGNSPNP